MPDMMAFDAGNNNRRNSNKGTPISSPLLCPPTPVRTPTWAHEPLTPALLTRQDSLCATKVLASDVFVDDGDADSRDLMMMDRNHFDLSDGMKNYSNNDNSPMGSMNNNHKINSNYNNNSNSFGIPASSNFRAVTTMKPLSVQIPENNSPAFFKPMGGGDGMDDDMQQQSQYQHQQQHQQQQPQRRSSNGGADEVVTFATDFENLGIIGSGAFADVYKVKSLSDRKQYAIKRNRRQFRGKRDRERALSEVRTMQKLQLEGNRNNSRTQVRSPFLLRFIKAWQEDGFFYSQTELCSRCNCRHLLSAISTDWSVTRLKVSERR